MEAMILLLFAIYVAVFGFLAYGVAVLVMGAVKWIRRKIRGVEDDR